MFYRNLAGLAMAVTMTVTGCGSLEVDPAKVVPAPARADEAIEAVATTYQLHSMPTVYWYGKGLTCNSGTGYVNQDGDCRSEEELDNVVTVALPDGWPVNQLRDEYGCAMLAHGMAHAASEQYGEGGCDDHNCRWFRGPCQAATAVLEEMGI